MRVYLPTTLPALAAVLAEGRVGGEPLAAFAVTDALRATGGDDEELEYEAMLAAGDASLRLLAADPSAPRRRVVLAADVPDAVVVATPDQAGPASVAIGGAVPVKRLASGHVDDADAADAIGAAAADPEAGHQDEHELMWYAVQELKYLVE
ncbi:DUF6912 family protein [Nocardiopsis potens]|uniref:DUF6912 family protein n=1 Tax=Nocardiopsis potens TaxID=1246458 RepID=UPI00034C5422|nr:hypothetical protein [Nocardiopsis potens]